MDSIVQECNVCDFETDCIEGICLNCRLLRDIYKKEANGAYANIGKIIRTPIGFHVDNCPGCMDVYFSREKQELIAVCNECGMKRQFLTNIEGNYGSILGCTIPFNEAHSEDHSA